jgi:NAD-dependent dihydropyrimidine dehydrogenase PreA subunit
MKRNIISIDEEKCTGCGQCIPDCPEGALQLIEGKARLVSDLFCDGLGACIGTCPEGAISVIEREAGAYDEDAVMERIVAQGPAVIKAHLEHLAGHGETDLYEQALSYLRDHDIAIPRHKGLVAPVSTEGHGDSRACNPFAGCPGSAHQQIPRNEALRDLDRSRPTGSELRQWPVQLRLLDPRAGFFDDADLLVSADCVPFAYPDFHQEFLSGKTLVIFCPKLDADIDGYIEKLSQVFALHEIRSVTVLRMEVPCCGGVRYVVDRALERSGKKMVVNERTVTLQGGLV